MRKILSIILLITSAAVCSESDKYDFVIRNVGMFDGHNDIGVVNIAIKGDIIANITKESITGDSTIDGLGKYIIPGLVDAHVHVSSIEQLKSSYSIGVLTLLNMHTGLEGRESGWKKISKDSLGLATLFGAGHAATVPRGHPTQFSPDMETINDSVSVEDWVKHRMASHVDYIKIICEHHEYLGFPPAPTLSYEQIHQLIDEAHKNGYKAVVHAGTVEDMVNIAPFNPDGFVHMLDYKEDLPIPDSYYKLLAKNNIFIVPTGIFANMPMKGASEFQENWAKDNFLDFEQRTKIIKKYYDNGILIVAGTDAQEGVLNFSGDYFKELNLYKSSGLSNLEVLKTATGNAAKAFDLPIGELKIGSKATFLLLNGNPLSDLNDLNKIEKIWKNGITDSSSGLETSG